jgi:hypothetical protein
MPVGGNGALFISAVEILCFSLMMAVLLFFVVVKAFFQECHIPLASSAFMQEGVWLAC